MTENKKPLVTEKSSTTETKNTIDKVSEKKLSEKKTDTTKTANAKEAAQAQPKGISKLALLALIIAIAAPVSHFYWQQQQSMQLTNQLSSKFSQENSANFNHFQSQFQQTLSKQRSDFTKQLQQVKEQTANASQEKIAKLNDTVSQLEQRIKQRQPSDWLLHESEYLIRVAARTLWLEHDTKAAIGLLKDADARLTELNDPAFLPVRELIHQDVKSLALMPTLQTDEIVLALMAMNKQVAILPLAVVDLDKNANQEQDLTLSDDISDWQSNLAKTWQKFLDDFIRVRQRTGTIEPLMAPKQQEHLKQNLSLKIQLALWAASERKGDIYHKALADIEQWLNDFFAIDHEYNQHFMEALITLQKQQVSYDYPSELASLSAIRAMLNKQMNDLPNQDMTNNTVSETTITKDNTAETVISEQQKNNDASNEGEL
ncbi:MAG: uroporphyrinogen-III C-methyltransferase [Colwellia sp.]|nr:uroporphyrinogen-III C-methyltransferase [Colwellia sp.]MCW8866325.1 uroporphyrinogen-III C-methyltransferase [Colwellia sp.]MCW9080653.1 uroporphyrinogen-III C-methyltransferase [Colwellia sp.]